jgi:AcrR family transcriptional regulator
MVFSMPRRKVSTSRRRARLLETAWRLFYRDGYRSVGIDTILAEASVAKMTLYNHFSSKDKLIVAVIEKRSEEILTELAATVEAAGKSAKRRLLAVFDFLEVLFGSRDFSGCAFIRAISEYPDTNHPVHRAAWAHKRAFRKMLVGLAKEAGAKDPAALADNFRLLIDGALVAAHATGQVTPAKTARIAANELLKSSKTKSA